MNKINDIIEQLNDIENQIDEIDCISYEDKSDMLHKIESIMDGLEQCVDNYDENEDSENEEDEM